MYIHVVKRSNLSSTTGSPPPPADSFRLSGAEGERRKREAKGRSGCKMAGSGVSVPLLHILLYVVVDSPLQVSGPSHYRKQRRLIRQSRGLESGFWNTHITSHQTMSQWHNGTGNNDNNQKKGHSHNHTIAVISVQCSQWSIRCPCSKRQI